MLIVEELQNSLLVQEERMKSLVEEEQVLKVSHEEITERGSFRGRQGHIRGRQSKKSLMQFYMFHNLGDLR